MRPGDYDARQLARCENVERAETHWYPSHFEYDRAGRVVHCVLAEMPRSALIEFENLWWLLFSGERLRVLA